MKSGAHEPHELSWAPVEIKQRCVEQKVPEPKFDLRDQITGKVKELQSRRHELESELHVLHKKKHQAQWYIQRKADVSSYLIC